jgi:hypothetical protein
MRINVLINHNYLIFYNYEIIIKQYVINMADKSTNKPNDTSDTLQRTRTAPIYRSGYFDPVTGQLIHTNGPIPRGAEIGYEPSSNAYPNFRQEFTSGTDTIERTRTAPIARSGYFDPATGQLVHTNGPIPRGAEIGYEPSSNAYPNFRQQFTSETDTIERTRTAPIARSGYFDPVTGQLVHTNGPIPRGATVAYEPSDRKYPSSKNQSGKGNKGSRKNNLLKKWNKKSNRNKNKY